MKAVTYVEIDVPSFVVQSPEQTQTFRFAMPTEYLDPEIEAIPSIKSLSINPAAISLGKDLGTRATISVTFDDHRHVFNGEPYNQGTFWGKWRGRYETKLRGREIRIIRGFAGQALEQMDTRYYIIESVDGPTHTATYTINARDILKLADDDRAQAPALSNGALAGTISDSATTIILSPSGIGDYEYPASGWVCLGGKEVCAFTRVSDTLTITRGQFGTVASGHDAGDRVQLVLRYDGDDAADIVNDLLVNYANVSSEYIDLTAWQAETSEHLGVIYARTITEPTSVNKLVSELIEQAALAVWWDDRARQVRLQVLREISTDVDTFGEDRILDGSFSVRDQPTKRISQLWTYYGQRDPTDSGANKDNYRAVLATTALEEELAYGGAEIAKIEAAWIETETAASRLNSIQISRFRDPPRAFGFDLARDTLISLAGGYKLTWWGNQDETGLEIPASIQVTRITLEPDRVKIEAEEMLAVDTVVLVNVVFLTTTGALLSWTVDETWNDADNEVHTIGGGGGGAVQSSSGGNGGGGGGYSRVVNLNLTPGASVSYRVGAGGDGAEPPGNVAGDAGGDTWFNGANLAASSCGAKGGAGGSVTSAAAVLGGQASAGVGSTKFSGGDGGPRASGDPNSGSGGGGGAAGPNGNGADGGTGNRGDGAGGGAADNGSDGASGVTGAGGNNRFDFGGGTEGQPNGDEGGGGKGSGTDVGAAGRGGDGEQIWTQTVSPIISAGPGGGGGGGGREGRGGDGGDYGGGGGGGGDDGPGAGDGAQGIIVIKWREAA